MSGIVSSLVAWPHWAFTALGALCLIFGTIGPPLAYLVIYTLSRTCGIKETGSRWAGIASMSLVVGMLMLAAGLTIAAAFHRPARLYLLTPPTAALISLVISATFLRYVLRTE